MVLQEIVMNPSEKNNEKWLDDVLTNALGSDGTQPNFEQWRKGHPEAIETLKSRADTESSVSQRPQNVWRTIMKNRMTKFATAAVIIIGVLLGLYFIGGPDMAGVAWAEVVENVEQIQTYMFRGKSSTTGGPMGDDVQEMEITVYWSLAHGMRMQSYMDGKIAMDMYMLPAEKMMIQLMPEQKRYMRMLLNEELLKKMEEEQNNPRYMVKQFIVHEYTELGRDIIDGIEVEGIETTDPMVWGGMVEKAVGRLWVDVETNLPVRIEMEMAMEDMETKLVMEQFEWGIELDTSLFEPVIPADYELMAEVELPDAGGEKAVQGLRLFAELTGGQYPSDMGMMTAMKEIISEAMREELGTEPNAMPSRETMEKLMNIQMVCVFYAQLVQEDKDPAYYGDKVTTEFPHAVLMRWRTADDQYRVIFGDLTIEDVTAQELAELEAMPLNLNPYPIKPAPADGAVAGGDELQLSWMPGVYVTEHEVYFGTEPDDLSLVGRGTEPVYDELDALQEDTIYYWRVDEVQPDGSVVAGDVWSFSTGALVGWWKLDSDLGDSSGNDNDGSIEGEPTYEPGRLGQAIKLDGDDWVVIPNSDLFNFTNDGDFTCSAWIRTNAEKGTIIAKAPPDAEARGMKTFFIQNGSLAFDVGYVGLVNSTVTVNDGRWHLVAVTIECSTSRDNDTVTLYVDGSPAVAKDDWDINVHSEQDGFVLKIGNGTEATLEGDDQEGDFAMINWNGMIDDVRLYSYALSEDEITQIYESEMAALSE
jgi:outer membrane lipoprotein-sorting protein